MKYAVFRWWDDANQLVAELWLPELFSLAGRKELCRMLDHYDRLLHPLTSELRMTIDKEHKTKRIKDWEKAQKIAFENELKQLGYKGVTLQMLRMLNEGHHRSWIGADMAGKNAAHVNNTLSRAKNKVNRKFAFDGVRIDSDYELIRFLNRNCPLFPPPPSANTSEFYQVLQNPHRMGNKKLYNR